MKKLFSIIITLLISPGCSKDDNEAIVELAKPLNISLSQEETIISDTNINFSLNLLQQIAAKNSFENQLFISPFSVNILLSLLVNGTSGDTADQLYNLLGWDKSLQTSANSYYKTMMNVLAVTDPVTQLSVANSIWYNSNKDLGGLQSDFEDIAIGSFESYLKDVDFSQTEYTKNAINSWCSEKTEGLITDMIEEVNLDDAFYLLNAVYFNSIWHEDVEFEETSENFTSKSGITKNVDMISTTSTLHYQDGDSVEVIEVPFGNYAFSFIGILPNEGVSIQDAIVELMTEDHLKNILDEINSYEYAAKVTLTMPELDIQNKIELNDVLQSMGVVDIFGSDAQIWNMFNSIKDSNDDDLSVDRVYQRSHFTLNKYGVEAATVTGSLSDGAIILRPVELMFNRPYLFFIIENQTQAILFEGIIEEL